MVSRAAGSEAFDLYLEALRRDHQRRVLEGDREHLVHYILQSRAFTKQPPIEPALSARGLVEQLPEPERRPFLAGTPPSPSAIPRDVSRRIDDFVRSIPLPSRDLRLTEFRAMARAEVGDFPARDWLIDEYFRVMCFVYKKEFAARNRATDIAALYESRGFSTDTAVENGYAVAVAVSAVTQLRPTFRARRVLLVGPGLDLAPRTGLREHVPPQSHQPFALADALLAGGLTDKGSLELVAADINPRVVAYLQRVRETGVLLDVLTGLGETGGVRFSAEYREYLERLGAGLEGAVPPPLRRDTDGSLRKQIRVPATVSSRIFPELMDVTVQRFETRFDLVVVTNVFPYLSAEELALAFTNIAAMLSPGGLLIHNEPRPRLNTLAPAVGLPLLHARSVTIATVDGAPAPLFDAVWIHERR